MASRHCFWANLLVLGAFVAVARAAICFEGTPRRTFRDDRFHITGSEADGRVCGIVVREPADVGSSDFESFSYSWSNLGAPIFGDAAAIGGVDFEAPSTRTASFNGSSLSVEICVDVLMDNVACEQSEDFSVQLASTSPAFNPICSDDRAVATIADSTAINIGFATSMNEVFENQGSIELEVVRAMGTQNLNVAQVTITEDPDTPGCLAGGSDIKYTCVAARCTDGNLFNLSAPIPRITILPLAPDDTVVDGHRECRILLQPFQGSTCVYNITTGSTQVRIIDNERLLMNFQPDFYEADEDSGGVDVTVQLTGSPSTTEDICFTILQSVNPATTPATIGVDLPNRTYSSSVLAGQTSATVRILFTPDQVFEETEVLMLNLVPCQNRFSFFPPARDATVQIKNDDGITVRFPESLTVNESDGEISFSLLIEEEYEGELCIFTLETREIVEELNGVIQAAKPGEDFTPVDATEICFRNNQSMSDPFRVLILNSSSNVPECNEVFSVKLETTSEFNLLMVTQDVSATVTIIDTSDPYLVQFSQNEYKVVEDLGGLDITVTVDRPPAFDILFTAVASVRGSGPENANIGGGLGIGIDVLNNMWNGTISAGSRSITIPIDVLPDNLTELDEEFYLDLSVSSKCQLVQANAEGSTALVVIEDDDSVEITVVFDSTVVEGEASVANITFTVVGQFNIPFAINVNFMDGSATDPTDYNGTSQTIVFNEDNRSLVVSVPIVNDGDTEENENFQFFAETDSSVRISVMTRNSMGSIVIEDNEVTHFFELTSYVVPEDSGSLRVSVRRRGDLSRSSAVHIAPANHSSETPASSSQDFPTSTVVASFSAGEELKEFEVPITSDMRSELNETFLLQLVEIPALLVEDLVVEPSQATVTITDFNDVVCVSLSASSYSATEGDGSAEFVVEADKSFSYEFSVVVTVMPVTATAGDDYTESSFELTFMPGQQSLTRSLSIIDDPVKEEQESVNLVLSVPDGNPRPVCINTPGTAALTIADNDDLSVQFELEEYSVSEGGTITVNVMASADFSKSFIVDISHDGAEDLSLSSPTLSFSPSSRTASVELTATTDSIKEPEESFTLTLAITDSMTQQFGVQLGTRSTAAVKVQDNSTSPECGFSPLNYTASEGSSVTLMLTCSELASVDYTLAVGHIGGDEDLTLSSTTVTIGAGSTQGSVELTATTDNIKECEESFQLTASLTASSTALGVTIGEGTATVAIADTTEDVAVNFDPASYTVSEGSTVEVFLTADKDYTEAFTVTVSSVNTEDITIQPSTVTFQPPSKRVSVMVEAVTDAIQEPTESVALTFTIGDSCLESVIAGSEDQATVSITDTSDAVVVCFDESTYSVTEGAEVTIGLSADKDFTSSFSVTVTHAAPDGDFTLEGIPLTFTPGGTSGSFKFVSNADNVKELNETVSLVLQVDNDGGIDVEICSQSTSMVTIVDDDDLTVTLSSNQFSVTEGNAATILVTASSEASQPYTVNVVPSAGTATEEDFTSGTYEATFSPGETVALVSIATADGDCAEPLESFTVALQSTSSSEELAVAIGSPSQAEISINDPTVVPVHFEMSSYEVEEGETFSPAIVVEQCYSGSFSVNVLSTDGTATAGSDYTAVNEVEAFTGNERAVLSIDTVEDTLVEGAEVFSVSLVTASVSTGLNVEIDPTSATFTIQEKEPEVSVSFSRDRYSVMEGDSILVQFTVTGSAPAPFTVRVFSEDGTATGGADFTVIDELVDPTTDDITVSALVDDVAESVESFQLSMELPAGVSPGTYAMATVFISDLGTRTVNDTVIADPVYSVPLKIVEGNIPGLSGDLSMCYEIHGKADTWFNLISDTCLSVNAHYSLIASSEDDAGHQIDTIGAVVVSNTNECKEVMVRMVDGKCSFTVNGVGVSSKSFEQDGVMVSKRRNRVRISAPNCENQMVVIWARCEEFASMDMMRLVVNRGFNLSPTSHGLIGQFWNIDASLEKYNDTIVANVYGVEAVKPHYLLHLSPPEPSEKRSMVGELHSNLWDGSEQTCLYVGSSQGGTIEEAIKPIATVIEGTYTDYIAGGPFDRAVKYNRFNSEVCQSP